jgi:acetyl-CoA synthetase
VHKHIPSKEIIQASNIHKIMQKLSLKTYAEFWEWSVKNKEQFWELTVENLEIQFSKKYSSIINIDKGVENARWLFESKLNIVDSCFNNSDNSVAVRYQEVGGEIQNITQQELRAFVNKTANGFVELGLALGSKIAIDMPMTLEVVVIYLAAIKAGLVVATIADSFSVEEINVRLEITKPELVFTQDVFLRNGKKLPLYEKVNKANCSKIIVVQTQKEKLNLENNDIFFQDFLTDNIVFESVKLAPDEMHTILFSSGTTGQPKAIPWDHTTPVKSASDGYYHHDIQKDDVVCWPTNLGWMMGPWLVFATLINKGCLALYYGTPLEQEFGKFVQDAKVNMLGVVPSIVKYWKSTKSMEDFDWSIIKCFSSTGEVSNPKEMKYLMQLANNKPIIEYCGGTEIGGGYVASTVVQENIPSQFSSQALGGEFVLLNDEGENTSVGEVFLIPPIMGLSTKLLNKNHHDTYYANNPNYNERLLRKHGDELQVLGNAYYKANGRVDDAMNLGGIKVSSIQIESVINSLDFVNESAAIAVSPKNGGPSELIVYYSETRILEVEEALKKVQICVKTKLNPLFKVVDLLKIDNLPRTASNKVKRKVLREQYQNTNTTDENNIL